MNGAALTDPLGWDEPIEVGDIVYLKSGSPAMSVESIEGELAVCIWFDKKKLRSRSFRIGNLGKQPVGVDGKARGILILDESSPFDVPGVDCPGVTTDDIIDAARASRAGAED